MNLFIGSAFLLLDAVIITDGIFMLHCRFFASRSMYVVSTKPLQISHEIAKSHTHTECIIFSEILLCFEINYKCNFYVYDVITLTIHLPICMFF